MAPTSPEQTGESFRRINSSVFSQEPMPPNLAEGTCQPPYKRGSLQKHVRANRTKTDRIKAQDPKSYVLNTTIMIL